QGVADTVTVSLVARPVGDLSGVVRAAGSLTPLEDAQVDLVYTPLHQHTAAGGTYAFPGLPDDTYRIDVRRPGFVASSRDYELAGTTALDFELAPTATWDALEAASGWTVGATGDNATSGIWTRVEPFGTGAPQHATAPPPSPSPSGNGIVRGPATPFHEGHEDDAMIPGDVQPAP